VILPPLLPLVLDGGHGVRAQLLRLLKSLPSTEVEGRAGLLLPYIRTGMTHLAADIRFSSVDILSWLLLVSGNEVVSCGGGWVKTVNCFLSLLGWHTEESGKLSLTKAFFGKAPSEGKQMAKVLQVFAEFLRAGIGPPDDVLISDADQGSGTITWSFPLHQTPQHLLPSKSAPFSYLNLFGHPQDTEGDMYETHYDRFRIFVQMFETPVKRGISVARKEGGEIGRASATVNKVLEEARGIWQDSAGD
jgi:pre-rRNA-processing protein IPI1